MNLRVVGAGLGRTGTNSLKLALERLLGGPCYHMYELMENLHHVPTWRAAIAGEPVDFGPVLDGYVATVDWPAVSAWRELAALNPDAVVLLSTRRDAAEWWRSASTTIFPGVRDYVPDSDGMADWHLMDMEMLALFEPNWADEASAMTAYERHNAAVRAEVPAERLLEWQPQDGWAPLCERLGVPVPDELFPRVNTSEEWAKRKEERMAELAAGTATPADLLGQP